MFNFDWPQEHSARALEKILQYDNKNSWWWEGSRLKILFDTLSLSIDFDSIQLISKDEKEIIIEKEADIHPKTIKNRIDYKKGLRFLKNGEVLELSSGQIIYSYMIPALASEIEEESLIIIDEPELYLHPSLEVGLISMLRHILLETSSYAIIATHSSVLAREVEASAVKILRKHNGITSVKPPTFENYGASLEQITKEAFDDFDIDKPFQADLDALIEEKKDIKQLISDFSEELGDSALVYLASKNFNDIDDDVKLVRK